MAMGQWYQNVWSGERGWNFKIVGETWNFVLISIFLLKIFNMTSKLTIILQLTRKRRFVHFWYSITVKLYQKMTFFLSFGQKFFSGFFNEMNLFSTQFWQKKMVNLNQKLIFHLKTENGAYGLNWKKTREFWGHIRKLALFKNLNGRFGEMVKTIGNS